VVKYVLTFTKSFFFTKKKKLIINNINDFITFIYILFSKTVCLMKYIYDYKLLKNNKKENHEGEEPYLNKPNPTFNGNMYNILTSERIFPVPTMYLPVVKLSNVNSFIYYILYI